MCIAQIEGFVFDMVRIETAEIIEVAFKPAFFAFVTKRVYNLQFYSERL
jgi:hypothetical protein